MKPMALNLKDAKKVAGDQHSSTFQVKGGHQMVIAHSGVSAIHRKQLEQMPVVKMADGEIVPDAPAGIQGVSEGSVPQGAPASSPSDAPAAAPDNSIPGDQTPDPSPEAPTGTPSDRAPAAAPIPQGGADVQGAYNQGQQAISEQQKVASDLAKSQQAIQEKDIADRQALSQDVQNNYKAFSDHQQQYMQDYLNGHVDPKHYQENMSTGSKVGTAIGLLLGGIASARTGSNPAQEFLNKQIDRDIAGQQSRIDQQKTLLGANQELYHDGVLATNQTRVNLNDMYDHKIQLAATKLGTPAAKAAADQAHAAFTMQNAPLLQQNAIRGAVLKRLQSGGQGVDAMDLAHAGFMPPEQAEKEQSSVNQAKAAVNQANTLFDQLDKEQSAGNLANPQSYARVKQIGAQLTPLVMDENPSKRLTPESYEKEIQPFLYSTGADKQTRMAARQGVLNLIKAAHAGNAPTMAKLAPGSMPNYTVPGGSAGEVQTKGGVQYQKVPGGWKRIP